MRFAVGGVSKTITAEGGNSKKPARREKLHIMGVCAALMAYLVILWIRGDAGTAQQTKHGGLYEPWWGSDTPGALAMVEDTQLDIMDRHVENPQIHRYIWRPPAYRTLGWRPIW